MVYSKPQFFSYIVPIFGGISGSCSQKKIVLVKEWECSNKSTEKIPNGPTQTEKKRLIMDSNSDIGFLGYKAFKLL